jgi:hypothetical protein
VWEAALAARDALTGADRANLFKTFAKVFFQKRNALATFMAKWSMAYPGQSGHCHFSFWRAMKPVLRCRRVAISATQRRVGGLRRYLRVAGTHRAHHQQLTVGEARGPTSWSWGIEIARPRWSFRLGQAQRQCRAAARANPTSRRRIAGGAARRRGTSRPRRPISERL